MDFVAIDVETANADVASICQIGIATFKNGALANQWKSYVDPEDHFDGMNVSIHGIDEGVVAGSPTYGMLADTIHRALNGRIVVTHTAFDKVAIYQAATKCKVPRPSCTWLDSACIARRAWKEFSKSGYGLANVCDTIGYTFNHHDALEDAKAAGNILLTAIAHTGLNLDAWLTRVQEPIDPNLEQRVAREGNPDGELFGEVLVFTGSLTIRGARPPTLPRPWDAKLMRASRNELRSWSWATKIFKSSLATKRAVNIEKQSN
jgi:DNA polymerase-3 subunit epsilon